MRTKFVPAVVLCLLPAAAHAGPLENSLKKLAPEDRAQQACVIKGMATLRRDKRLPHADRINTGVFGPAAFDGTVVTAKGGAVRAKGRWFALKFECTVTADQMKATSFTYELGAEIPETKWETYGLWR
jgi:Domain of Unknown Function (DUF930)